MINYRLVFFVFSVVAFSGVSLWFLYLVEYSVVSILDAEKPGVRAALIEKAVEKVKSEGFSKDVAIEIFEAELNRAKANAKLFQNFKECVSYFFEFTIILFFAQMFFLFDYIRHNNKKLDSE